MPAHPALPLPDDGKLAQHITHLARALRRAGLPIGPGRVLTAIEAVAAAGFTRRDDFYWVLHACFVNRPEERQVFHQVFRLFWRDPRYMEHMMALMLPALRGAQTEPPAAAAARRAAEALLDGAAPEAPANRPEDTEPPQQIEIDASRTASAEERLRRLDFEQMTADEAAAARRMLARNVRNGRPLGISGLPDRAKGPGFATVAGMLVYPQVCGKEYVQPRAIRKLTGSDGYLARVGSWLKSGFA